MKAELSGTSLCSQHSPGYSSECPETHVVIGSGAAGDHWFRRKSIGPSSPVSHDALCTAAAAQPGFRSPGGPCSFAFSTI